MIKILLCIFFLCPLIANAIDNGEIVSGFKESLIKKGIKLLNEDKGVEESENKSSKLIIDLRNPSFKNGVLTTTEGGVIQSSDIYIQAQTIQYVKKAENGILIQKLEADGNLMVIYKGRVYVGDEVEFDFTSKTGIIYNGRTYISPWYLGGDTIILKSDGSYKIENVSITTCESIDSAWDLHAGNVKVNHDDMLKAKKVRFRFFKIPTLWLPSFKVNLKRYFSAPILRYKFSWDGGSGPKAYIRYQIYSWREFALFLRGEYRVKRGFGGSIETEYFPQHGRTTFTTKSYVARDALPSDPSIRFRYRLQGAYHSISPIKKTTMDITWDKFSDVHMPGDFKSDDFEINTAKKTEFTLRNQQPAAITLLHARPRVNTFETVKQDIPTLYITMHPLTITPIGVILENSLKASYLKLSYTHKLHPVENDIEAMRIETKEKFSRPVNFSIFNLFPSVGSTQIIYGQGPSNSSAEALISVNYGARLSTRLEKNINFHKHAVIPYINFKGETSPTLSTDRHYIFSIQDGYHKLNLLSIGLKNELLSLRHNRGSPTFETDLYVNTFLGNNALPLTLPKLYLNLTWNLPSICIESTNGWNFEKDTIDYSNLKIGWTAGEDAAFAIELRYRSKYDWRKANHEDFILDVARGYDNLISSPLSDERGTLLTHIFLRLSSDWTCHFETHHGWRPDEPYFNEFKIELATTISSSWKVKLNYAQTQTGPHVSAGFELVKR